MTHALRQHVIGLLIAATAVTAAPASAAGQEVATGTTLQRFERELNGYLALRWRATRDLPLLDPSAPLPELIPNLERHIRAVRRARTWAPAGALFDANLTALLRSVIAATLDERCVPVREVIAVVAADAPAVFGRARVNDRWPWLRDATMPRYLVDALPPLPYELQYRFVQQDLVLLDVELGLVIDVLRDALPARLDRR